ncbi:MAG: response regulator transcription factor [Rikenellaceae bacterium]|nr:response regulator transcription factor [Rikenellaceae bacterium]
MSRTLRIAVAEPSLIVRSGLVAVLQGLPGFNIQIVEIGDVAQIGVSLCRQRPDLLIVNPSLVGASAPGRLRGEAGCSRLRCVALLYALADSALLKEYDETITVFDTAEQVRDKLLRLAADSGEEPRQEALSAREKEIIVGVVRGLTNKQIAEQLCLSAHTVITHRRNIAAKLQIHSPAGLTIYAIVNKLVELNEVKDTIVDER